MKNKIITLLGGSGTIGRNLVNSLIKKNFRVIITTRNSYQNTYLKTQATPGALELIDWDAKNFDKIEEAIKNSDIVINLIGILYETRKQKFDQIHAGIPQAISKLCAKANVEKFITVSAIGSSPDSKSAYQRSKFKGEQNALNNFDRTIILRPSVIESSTSNFSRLFARLSFLPIFLIPNLTYRIQPIMISDVVSAIIKIIEEKNNFKKIYEIGGPKIFTMKEMITSIMKIIGKKRFIVEMPMPLAKIQSSITDLLPFPPILTRDQCEILSEGDNVVSNNHLTLKDLGIEPSDVEKEMASYLYMYREGGQFSKIK